MNLDQAAKLCGVSRQAIGKAARVGTFRAGGQDWIGRKTGKFWDLILARQHESHSAENGKQGGYRPQSQTPPMDALRAKRLWTQIKLDEQKLAENDRMLRRRFAECVNNAIKGAGADFSGRARALRLPPDVAEKVGELGLLLKEEFKTRFQQEVEEWEKELTK